MKKNLLFIFVVSIAVLMSSCGGDSAMRVNKVLVEKSETVAEFMSKAMDYFADDEYESALECLDIVTNYVDKSTPIVARLQNKSAEKWQQATLEYLAIYKAGAADYKQAIEWFQADENFEEASMLVINFILKASSKLEEMQEIQAEFAKANNIELTKR